MQTTYCELCDHPAVIHETIAHRAGVRVRHLCRYHGLKLWRDAVEPATAHLAQHAHQRAVKSPVTIPPGGQRPERKTR
ncbi:MAG: hypothetical protein KF861_12625 [Planctomycetaceae bacterium]|nr:hypothetical protein [Planctomycetaceae bacterium]